jgi:hypothetical protein
MPMSVLYFCMQHLTIRPNGKKRNEHWSHTYMGKLTDMCRQVAVGIYCPWLPNWIEVVSEFFCFPSTLSFRCCLNTLLCNIFLITWGIFLEGDESRALVPFAQPFICS